MYSKKRKMIFEDQKSNANVNTNAFINSGMLTTNTTRSENGALKYTTSFNDFVDQFASLGAYKVPRAFSEIDKDMTLLYSLDKKLTMSFIIYLRLISRSTVVLGTKLPIQNGAGLKHEAIMRMLWLENKDPELFYNNLIIFVSAGSWKDVFKMLQTDLIYNGWDDRKLDWNRLGNFILNGLNTESELNLIKKYLPQIKAKSACKTVEAQANTMIAKWICSLIFGTKNSSYNYKQYRILKNTGNAHEWQQLISQRKFELIDFGKIHGRALQKLVSSKFLSNQGLENEYTKFILSPNNKAVKFTGFVHELFERIGNSKFDQLKLETINKQFNQLVQQAKDKDINTNLIVVRDTSGSMDSNAPGTNMSCYDLAKALALYLSEFLNGQFKNHWIEFNSDAKMHEWKGNSPTEKWFNDKSSYVGSTNFMSVIKLFCDLKKSGIDESEFPKGIICISDCEFNPSQLNKTNVESARTMLKEYFSEEYANNFIIVLWNVYRKQSSKFETSALALNTYYFSGFDASTISLLTSNVKNSKELFEEAMNQDIMKLLNF